MLLMEKNGRDNVLISQQLSVESIWACFGFALLSLVISPLCFQTFHNNFHQQFSIECWKYPGLLWFCFGFALVLLWFCFGFALFSSVIGPKKLAPLSQTIRYKTAINLDLVCCIFLVFWAVSLFLLWVLRGLFWLNVMITFMTLSLQTLLSKNHFLISNFSIRKVVRKFKVLLKLAATWRIIYLCVLLPSAATCLVNDLERMVVHKSHAFHS